MIKSTNKLSAACAAVAILQLTGIAQADTMVQWGAPGGENIISAEVALPHPPDT